MPKLKLLPCPFCGKDVAKIASEQDLEECINFEDPDACPACFEWNNVPCSLVTVVCSYPKGGCGACGAYGNTEEEAAENWNRRAGKMDEYIEREKILESLRSNYYDPSEDLEESYMAGWKVGFNSGTDHAIHDVIHTKPADVRPVVPGRWEEVDYRRPDYHGFGTVIDGKSWRCSNCGNAFKRNTPDMHFCPECGADMRGDEPDA